MTRAASDHVWLLSLAKSAVCSSISAPRTGQYPGKHKKPAIRRFFQLDGHACDRRRRGAGCLVLGIQDHHCSGGGTAAVVNGGVLPYMLDPVVGGAFQQSLGHRGPNHAAPKCRVSGTDDGRDTDRRRRRGRAAGAAASCSSIGIAALKLGLVACNVKYKYRPEELQYLLEDSGPAVLVINEDFLPTVELIAAQCPQLEMVVVIGPSARAAPPGAWPTRPALPTVRPRCHPTRSAPTSAWSKRMAR